MIQALAVFFCTFVAEGFWTKWAIAANEKRAAHSANFSAGIVAVSAITTIVYVGNPWYIIPAILGAWCGTYVAVKNG